MLFSIPASATPLVMNKAPPRAEPPGLPSAPPPFAVHFSRPRAASHRKIVEKKTIGHIERACDKSRAARARSAKSRRAARSLRRGTVGGKSVLPTRHCRRSIHCRRIRSCKRHCCFPCCRAPRHKRCRHSRRCRRCRSRRRHFPPLPPLPASAKLLVRIEYEIITGPVL